jgi:hypothetical protein
VGIQRRTLLTPLVVQANIAPLVVLAVVLLVVLAVMEDQVHLLQVQAVVVATEQLVV